MYGKSTSFETAEDLFRTEYHDHVFKSAGVSAKYCGKYGTTLCTIALLEWADKVFVMEDMHVERIRENAGEQYLADVHVLDIEDRYQYMQPELIGLLKAKLEGLL